MKTFPSRLGKPQGSWRVILYALLTGLVSSASQAELHTERDPGIALLPRQITLTGSEAGQQLLAVKRAEGGAFAGPLEPGSFTLSSSRPDIIRIDEAGRAVPLANGTSTLTLRAGEQTATATVSVFDFDKPWSWSFRNHVLPVFARNDCNTGGCHGALAGKGGFRLSLFGYDPEDDYFTTTRQSLGRRIEPSDPGRSLLLTKPTTALRHKGGKRLDVGSEDYRVLAEWIAAGASPPSEDDAQLDSLSILPELSVLAKGQTQPLVVIARYSDGREEDVTRWVRFEATDQTVADVDEHGTVSVTGHGEGAITAWFSSLIVTARIGSPYPNQIPAKVFAEAPRRNFIDELNLEQLERLNLEPSPRASDAAFIRRAYLDTIGRLPTAEGVRAFLADPNPDKRDLLIEGLLGRDEFVDYWTYKWADVFLISGNQLRPQAVEAYYQWLRAQVEAGTPWDDLAREVVTAKGSSVENGATNFFAVHQDPETMAENVSQAFLSLSINCAKCHNHPLEKWTNDQYYSFANLFSRVRAKGWGGDKRNGDGVRSLYVVDQGELIQPRIGKPQPPAPLDGEPIDMTAPGDRREVLAEWLTDPSNPYFTRAIVNRVWANFFGVGLVESVDDLRVSNPASNEALLQAASEFLVEHDFKLPALMRVILQSETYQRSSQPLSNNAADTRFYSRYFPRRLMAEVLSDAISDLTGVPDAFTETLRPDGSTEKTEFYPEGTRALQLYDSAVKNYFLKTFGRNPREITCDCERSNQPSMVQVLHLSNGTTINDKLADPRGRLTAQIDRIEGERDYAAVIEEAYLGCLARLPTGRESKAFVQILEATPVAERRAAIEDLYWSLMTSREFLFQH